MQYTAPAMIAVWMAMRTRRWPSGKEYAAIALALTGTFFLVTHGDFSALSITGIALFWGIASAVAAAFNSIQPAGLLHKYSAAYVTGWGMLIGGVALCFVHQPWNVEGIFDATTYLFIAFILLFGSLAAFYLYLKAIRLIGPQYTSLLSCAEPLSAAVLAVLWLGVSFGPMDWLGTALILTTIVLLAKKQTADTQSEKVT
jgi:drug/metabolite transporter (DMT)-like permease